MAKFLMCPPDHYEVAYEINAWMSMRREVDHDLAVKQWQALHDLLSGELGARVEIIPPVKGLPDMVFTANAGLIRKRMFVRSNFRHRERKEEARHFARWFRDHSYIVRQVDEPYVFEGEGDALFLGPELMIGFHFRSDLESHSLVAAHLKTGYFALELGDERFYHLDTCFAPLNDQAALLYPKALEPYARKVLMEVVPDLIEVSEEEALRFACNAVVVDDAVILPQGCPGTKQALEQRKFRVFELDFSEFIKAGGAGKCLVLQLDRN